MKTPEELAEEYAAMTTNNLFYREPLSNAFLAGYKAAQEHAHAALEEAEAKIQELQDQLADADKVMPDSCEHILDMEKMVDVNGWISVKDRMPEDEREVIIALANGAVTTSYYEPGDFGWAHAGDITHWGYLPAPPKEEA
jgi:hypothetical protein